MIARRSRDVPRSAGAGAGLVNGAVHCLDDDWILPLPQVVVRAPDDDFARLSRRRCPGGVREGPAMTLQVGEDAITSFTLHLFDRVPECCLVVHNHPTLPTWSQLADG